MKFKFYQIVLLTVLVLVPSVAAAQIIPRDNEAFGTRPTKATEEMVGELKTAVAVLRLPPLNPREICHLWERYAASHVLKRRIDEIPDLLVTLGISQTEINTWQMNSARQLAKHLSEILWARGDRDLPLPACQYWTVTGPAEIFHYTLVLENRWEVADALLRARKQYSFSPDDDIVNDEWIIIDIKAYLKDGGAEKYRKAWLENDSYLAGETLHTWLVGYRFAPSLLGLTPEQTAKLLEESGRK